MICSDPITRIRPDYPILRRVSVVKNLATISHIS